MQERMEGRVPGVKRLAIVGSVVLFFIAAIPFWWRLTEVYRAPLPFGDVEEFAEQLSSSALALPCQLEVVFLSNQAVSDKEAWSSRLDELRLAVQQRLSILNDTGCHQVDVVATLDAKDICLNNGGHWSCGYRHQLDEHASKDDIDEALHRHKDNGAGRYSIAVFLGGDSYGATIGKYRHAWVTLSSSFPTEHKFDSVSTLLLETATLMLRSGRYAEPMPIAADGTAILSFSLLNANPSDWIFEWDFNDIEARYLLPIVRALAPVARLKVESQVLFYTPSAARSKWKAGLRSYVIDSAELPFFVNSKEWHLDTSTAAAARSKVLHFAIYIPAMDHCPLRFKAAETNVGYASGFTSPGWGGVAIWNPPGCSVDHNSSRRISVDSFQQTMAIVVGQIRALFGLSIASNRSLNIETIPNVETGFAEWELDLLIRRRVVADIYSTASTLNSLLKLVKSLPKMVIQEEIGVQVISSLEAAKKATESQTTSYDVIGDQSMKARAWADAAFFHPSIMSLLHFPKEHQFAMYTPFFVPVLLHTLAAAFKETKRYLRKRKEYQNKPAVE